LVKDKGKAMLVDDEPLANESDLDGSILDRIPLALIENLLAIFGPPPLPH